MNKIIISALAVLALLVTHGGTAYAASSNPLAEKLKGRIVLQAQQHGEAWYVNPTDKKRYFLGRPSDAFEIMRNLGLGISNKDFDSFEMKAPAHLSGRILLKVQDSGKAYYVNPKDLAIHYLGRSADAFQVMRSVGLGITDNDLAKIQIAESAKQRIDIEQKIAPKNTQELEQNISITDNQQTTSGQGDIYYSVVRVVDGDTFEVDINGTTKRIRAIGMDTPETVDPRKTVQCFGKEASLKAAELLLDKKVRLEADPTQGEWDKYNRLLRYAYREDGLFFNKWMIENGYAFEYTYILPYKHQDEFKEAQKTAREQANGLWSSCPIANEAIEPPQTDSKTSSVPGSCTIKGNINTKDEKIYHVDGCGSYNQTKIDESRGERWFCSEEEALAAGWRKAKNCS